MNKKPTVEELEHKIEKLEESEKKYRQLFETAMVGIYRTRINDGKILAANQTLAELMGYDSVDQFVKEYVTSKHYTDPKRREELLYQIRSQGRVDGFEIEMARTDGSLVTIEISAAAYPELGYLEGVVIDITKRKQAEDALRESERKYFILVQESPDAIISLDKKGHLLSFNPAAERKSGFLAKEVMGKHFAKIGVLAKQSIPKALKEFALVITGIERPPFELTIMRKDKSYLFMEANPRLIKHKGEKAWIQVTLRDITDRKLVEAEKKRLETQLQQSQKMESIGTLAGGIAHDFNNILYSIIGYAELALDDAETGTPLYENLQELLIASHRAGDLVKQILTFSRQVDQTLKPLKIQMVVREALKLIRSSLPSTIEINQNISNTCGLVMADATQIHQVAMNLLTNAFHAMEDQGGKLDVTLKEIDLYMDDLKDPAMLPGSYVCLTVADTGAGIDKSIIDRIFEPYFSTKEKNKGTGLGLSMVHGIVKRYGGNLRVYSEPGKGSAFHVYLPVIQTQAETKETQIVSPVEGGKERILLVDDEEQIVRMSQQMLERLGYQVTARTSSIETLEAFRAAPDKFDLVITDTTMPNMTGIDLARKLMEIRSDIPIIICTGFSEKISRLKANSMGIRGYVMKPVVKSELAKKIREVLDQN
ncbi:MAG: PAS domain S-box protein [Deltaproteobacteria bacterium]|nr:PAS domain S-box protein [Deltaproteobacteria bacterium]